jgi:crotonobetainyl-CoA:carnitine CoA-transferase CaiB-like acyl-CoA transferase
MYPCKDGWVLISAGDQHHWPRVCSALGKPQWREDPRFTTRHERTKHAAAVNEAMRDLLADMTMKDGIAHFTRHDVVAAPVNTIPQAAQDSHPWERGAMAEVPDFLAGTIAVSGDFWHFSRTPAVVGSTPKVGEHNEEVLGGLLGYSEEEIKKLYANDVIGNWDHYDTVPG